MPITIEATESLIGRASPARPTLSSAGNYVAAQTLTVTGPDGTYQNVTVNENEEIGSVATNLNALAGITATYDNAEATLNFFNTDADEGDIIQFNLNGIAVQATAGANAAATYANIDTALAGVLPTANLSYTNNGSGEFGFVETIKHRRRPIRGIHATNQQQRMLAERIAINSVVQGSAADLIKVAMNNVSKALSDTFPRARLLLQIHDELVVETPEEDGAAVRDLLVDRMQTAIDLDVPIVADASIGSNWYECK